MLKGQAPLWKRRLPRSSSRGGRKPLGASASPISRTNPDGSSDLARLIFTGRHLAQGDGRGRGAKARATLRAAMRPGGPRHPEVDLVPGGTLQTRANKVRWSEDISGMFGLGPATTQPSVGFFFSLGASRRCGAHPPDRRVGKKKALPAQGRLQQWNFPRGPAHGLIQPALPSFECRASQRSETTGQGASMLGTVRDTLRGICARGETIRGSTRNSSPLTQHPSRTHRHLGTMKSPVLPGKSVGTTSCKRVKHVSPETYDPNIEQSVSLLQPDVRRTAWSLRFLFGARCLASNETDYFVECRIISPPTGKCATHQGSQAIIIRDRHCQPGCTWWI